MVSRLFCSFTVALGRDRWIMDTIGYDRHGRLMLKDGHIYRYRTNFRRLLFDGREMRQDLSR